MFENVHKHIKRLAIVIFVLMTAGSLAGGVYASYLKFCDLAQNYDTIYFLGIMWLVLIGLVVFLVGTAIGLAVSWIIYGYGTFVENTSEMYSEMYRQNNEEIKALKNKHHID